MEERKYNRRILKNNSKNKASWDRINNCLFFYIYVKNTIAEFPKTTAKTRPVGIE
jgi:hypothetical protein